MEQHTEIAGEVPAGIGLGGVASANADVGGKGIELGQAIQALHLVRIAIDLDGIAGLGRELALIGVVEGAQREAERATAGMPIKEGTERHEIERGLHAVDH